MAATRDIHGEMAGALRVLLQYGYRTRPWLQQSSYGGCESLLRHGSADDIILYQPIVSPVLPEELCLVPQGTFAVISCEISDLGIFREYVTPSCLPKIIRLLIQMRDEARVSEDPDAIQRANSAILAIRRLRALFCNNPVDVPKATEALCAEAPLAFSYAISVVRQAVHHNARPELAGLYEHSDLDEMYRFGVETIGELVADPEMITGAMYTPPQNPEYPPDVSHTILRWVAFLCMELHATMSIT